MNGLRHYISYIMVFKLLYNSILYEYSKVILLDEYCSYMNVNK